MMTESPDVQDVPQAPSAAELETLDLFRTFRATREIALRDKLVCKYLHLVNSVARRFSSIGESVEDLVQEGTIGLLNAVDLFDPERGVKFSTYACHLITSQIQHYLRDRGRLIRQPAWVQELSTKIHRATEQLSQELGRDPQPKEIAEYLNIAEESVQNVLAARELNHVVSLSAPADGTGESDMSLLDKERLRSKKLAAQLQLPTEDRIVLDEAVNKLKPLEQQVIRLFFFGDLNQTEIARKLGISVNYSSYLLRRAIAKIKTAHEELQQHESAVLVENEPSLPIAANNIAIYDPLSGVYTGAYLRVRVSEEIARGKRYPMNFAVMLAQINGLAENHAHYEQCLREIGVSFRAGIRMVDLLGYMGSEQFVFLLPHTGREARVLGERLCAQMSTRELLPKGSSPALSLCIGFAVFPTEGTTTEMLFDRAAKALDVARKGGPGTVLSASAALYPR